jgi:homoserine kinase type II
LAVYTELSDEELGVLLALYDLGRPLAFKGIAEGVENSNFLLETEAGRFFLTIYEKRVARADLPFFMSVMERLADKGLPAPRPIRTKAGAVLAETRGKACAIITFLTGLSPRRPTAAQCRAVGEALARMHRALDGFSGSRANALGPNSWEALVAPRTALAETLRPNLAATAADDLSVLMRAWPADLPRGVIHADLFPDNVLFVGEAVSGLIDFYFACVDFLAYDLAVCLNAWCFEPGGQFNLTKGRALIGGYEGVRALTPGEREALPTLARGAAMRFFATRLADWAETPPGALVTAKDPLEYADKLDFHRRAKSAGDYGG